MPEVPKGKLYCSVCDHTFLADSLEEALESADHSIGAMKKRPCPNNPQFMTWNGKPVLSLTSNFPSAIPSTIYVAGVKQEHGNEPDISAPVVTDAEPPVDEKPKSPKKSKK